MIFLVVLPHFAEITVVPLDFAVTFPEELTEATEDLLLFQVTVPEPVMSAPREILSPLARLIVI